VDIRSRVLPHGTSGQNASSSYAPPLLKAVGVQAKRQSCHKTTQIKLKHVLLERALRLFAKSNVFPSVRYRTCRVRKHYLRPQQPLQ